MPRSPDLDPEGKRLPVRFDGTSNGEFIPRPPTVGQHHANRLAHETATENAKRLGIGRRAFLASSMGAAATLAACNRANPGSGGAFAISEEAALEPEVAEAAIGGDEFHLRRPDALRRSFGQLGDRARRAGLGSGAFARFRPIDPMRRRQLRLLFGANARPRGLSRQRYRCRRRFGALGHGREQPDADRICRRGARHYRGDRRPRARGA